ncbi:hypothetical protein N7517_004431 [Penicillium concentricum]|uniref:Uncharacterized protein n=1 Tax=Penicillium concentricum TaxID=293559 RepID=A0A9W9S5V9_9EURO|nr:uncharacterized protein N7517_004431 [Penicillium concentricum]KAJ5372425.1 hypothetical protein N7517_004431 [Penicillium concentricum]
MSGFQIRAFSDSHLEVLLDLRDRYTRRTERRTLLQQEGILINEGYYVLLALPRRALDPVRFCAIVRSMVHRVRVLNDELTALRIEEEEDAVIFEQMWGGYL